MIKILYITLMIVLGTGSAYAKQPVHTVRGAWITAWSDGFFTPEQVDETLEAAKQARINNIFIQVRKNADAYYASDIEKPGAGLQEGFDPLEYMLPRAHKMGIKVHAWINVFRVWTAPNPPDDIQHIVNRHPDWLNVNYTGASRSSDGVYLDPGCSEARKYVLGVITDIARRYKVDGIHLDYIRYPGNSWGYSKVALASWQKASKRNDKPEPADPEWSEWRRSQVTGLVKSIFVAVRKVRPKAQVTASVICWGEAKGNFEDTRAYKDALQNWRKWGSAGYLDAIAPMNYVNQQRYSDRFSEWLDAFRRWNVKRPVYVGLYAIVNTPEDTYKQAQLSEKSGLAGWVLFSFNKGTLRDNIVQRISSVNNQ